MAKYKVEFAESFHNDLEKLDRSIQRLALKWIEKHLHNVDFPTTPGKSLSGELAGYVRFRVANYRILAIVDKDQFIILNLHIGHRSDIYKRK